MRLKKNNSFFRIDEVWLVIAVAVIAIIFSAGKNSQDKMGAEKITEILLDHHSISFVDNGIIDEKKLNEIKGMDYAQFKNYIKAKNDFCIYIEDENGNLILAKGSSKLGMNTEYCKE